MSRGYDGDGPSRRGARSCFSARSGIRLTSVVAAEPRARDAERRHMIVTAETGAAGLASTLDARLPARQAWHARAIAAHRGVVGAVVTRLAPERSGRRRDDGG